MGRADVTQTDRRLADNTQAPSCMVRFECPECGGQVVLDAYRGVPRHEPCGRVPMVAKTVVVGG